MTSSNVYKGESLRRRNFRKLIRNKQFLAGGFVIAVLVILAIAAPWIAPYDPFERDARSALQPPSWNHLFGTDSLGRDLFSQVVYGTRPTLTIGVVSVSISLAVGVPLGISAGYFGGWWDNLVSAFIGILWTFPSFLLALGIIAILGSSLTNAMIAVGISGIPAMARLARGEALSLRNADYVEATRAVGGTSAYVLRKSVLPGAFSPILVVTSLQFPAAVLGAAGLSFLGLGAQPPSSEWGYLIVGGRDFLGMADWLVNIPGLAILVTVLSFNLVGNALRDALDPRM